MSKITSEVAIKAEHLQLIRQSRPLVNPDIPEKEITLPEIGGAFPVYNVGLNALKATKVAFRAAPMMRVQELNTAKKIAATYEVSSNASEATIPAVHTDSTYLAKLNTSFLAAQKSAQAATMTTKMRMINIPALHTEAYWLHYDDPSLDMVVPIHSFVFPNGVPVPYAVFIKKMSEEASKVPDVSNNELGG